MMERATATWSSIAGGERWALGSQLGTNHCAINWYSIPPGSGLPGGVHAHADQRELFVVLDGTATFETFDGRVTIGPDEAVRFEDGEFHHGRATGETTLELLAVGAPRETSTIHVPFACADCETRWLRLNIDGRLTFDCDSCRTSVTPALTCPDCRTGGLTSRLDADCEPVARCDGCGTSFDRPPLA